MQVSAALCRAAPLRASTTAARRPSRSLALRAVAFRIGDEEPTPTKSTPKIATPTINTEEFTAQISTKAQDALAWAQAKWEASDNKPAIVATGAFALFGLYIVNGVVSTIDRLPLLHTVFELVGVGVSAWFAYKWFFVAGEKEAITKDVKGIAKDVGIDL